MHRYCYTGQMAVLPGVRVIELVLSIIGESYRVRHCRRHMVDANISQARFTLSFWNNVRERKKNSTIVTDSYVVTAINTTVTFVRYCCTMNRFTSKWYALSETNCISKVRLMVMHGRRRENFIHLARSLFPHLNRPVSATYTIAHIAQGSHLRYELWFDDVHLSLHLYVYVCVYTVYHLANIYHGLKFKNSVTRSFH